MCITALSDRYIKGGCMKRFIRRLFCKHNRIWEFYPDSGRTYFRDKTVVGLKFVICMDCKRIIKIEDYAE